MGAVGAFFDLDGTLISAPVFRVVLARRRLDPTGRRLGNRYWAAHLPLLPLKALRLVSRERYYYRWGADLCSVMRDMPAADAPALFHAVAEDLLTTVRTDVRERLEWHRQQGHVTALVSGTFAPLLGVIAGRMGVAMAVGTELEQREGRFTGRRAGPFLSGPAKWPALEAALRGRGLAVDLSASYAYADRIDDADFLSHAGHPIAVHPDKGLRALAAKRGWGIMG